MKKIFLSVWLFVMLALTPNSWSGSVHFDAYQKLLGNLKLNTGAQTDESRLNIFMTAYWDYLMHDDPEWATYTGYPGLNAELGDMSFAAIQRRNELAKLTLQTLASINRNQLSEKNQLNLDLLLRDAALDVSFIPYPTEFFPINQLGGVHQDLTELIRNMPRQNQQDYENILSRLSKAPTLIRQNIALLKKGMELKITPPKIPLRSVPEQIRALIVDDFKTSPFWEPFQTMPDTLDDALMTALRQRATDIYNQGVRPALKQLADFVEQSYLPACRETVGLSALQNGLEWYQLLIRVHTTTNLTPDQIHNIGLGEVKRIRAEMEKIKTSSGFKGTLNEFFHFLRTDPQFFFTDKTMLVMTYRDIAKRADAKLTKLFGHLPELPYGVEVVPSYMEKEQTTAYYQPGSLATGLPGIFYANTYDLKSRPKWEMEALTLHEAVPGHHLQISLAKELQGLPEFRKEADYTAFIEGWGLYAESLGADMGFYQNPYNKFGQLTYEMWRAIRLVVDTGLHTKGWTREQAIQYFIENAGKAEHDIAVEVDRYIVWPGQALAYKIGQLKFKELREITRAKLGDKFDIRAFHDEVLSQGALPLDVLEGLLRKKFL